MFKVPCFLIHGPGRAGPSERRRNRILHTVYSGSFDKERGSPGLHATLRLGRFYRVALESDARHALFMSDGSGFRSVAGGSQRDAARHPNASASL